MREDWRVETYAIFARCAVVGVTGKISALMVILLVFCGYPDALNELGDQVSELLLAARGKPMPEGRRNWWNTVLVVG